jgi:SAM-dependent methyltransferase
MENVAALNTSNRIAYSSPDITRYYGRFDVLFEAERILLDYLRPKIQNSRILDLGIGGGRTTKHLLEITSEYVGLDYAPEG